MVTHSYKQLFGSVDCLIFQNWFLICFIKSDLALKWDWIFLSLIRFSFNLNNVLDKANYIFAVLDTKANSSSFHYISQHRRIDIFSKNFSSWLNFTKIPSVWLIWIYRLWYLFANLLRFGVSLSITVIWWWWDSWAWRVWWVVRGARWTWRLIFLFFRLPLNRFDNLLGL